MRHSNRAFLLVALLASVAALAETPTVKLAPRNGVLRVAIVGDAGAGTEAVARGIARVHAEKPLEAIILPGDNIYPCGVRSVNDAGWAVLQPLIDLGLPMFPVLGNHDYCGNPDAQLDAGTRFPEWHFPAREYLLQAGVADFAMIDTTPYVRAKSRMPDAGAMLAASTAPWRIVVGHHTIISSGYHGFFPRDEHHRMRALLKPLRAAHVDLYICGHDHHLELVDTRPRMLVSGAASEPIPPLLLRPRTIFPSNARRQGGFAVVELTSEAMTIAFYNLGGRGLVTLVVLASDR